MDCQRGPQIRATTPPAAVIFLCQKSRHSYPLSGKRRTLRWRSRLYDSPLSAFVQIIPPLPGDTGELTPEQSRELILQHAVAFAGVGFEPITVEDRQSAPSVTETPGFLEDLGCDRHAGTPHAQQVGQKLMSDRKGVCLN